MAIKPKSFCNKPQCTELVNGGYCEAHKPDYKRQYDKYMRPEYRKLYHNRHWKGMRLRVLSEEPFCRMCLAVGIITKATDVDHIISHKGNTDLFYALDNLQALCHSCHSKKTIKE